MAVTDSIRSCVARVPSRSASSRGGTLSTDIVTRLVILPLWSTVASSANSHELAEIGTIEHLQHARAGVTDIDLLALRLRRIIEEH